MSEEKRYQFRSEQTWFSGSIDFHSGSLLNISDAIEPSDAVPLGQVQSLVSSSNPFLRNETNISQVDIISQHQSIFNPDYLLIKPSSTFIVETSASYYVLGDLTVSGSLTVEGTLKVGGILYVNGPVTGSGIIE